MKIAILNKGCCFFKEALHKFWLVYDSSFFFFELYKKFIKYFFQIYENVKQILSRKPRKEFQKRLVKRYQNLPEEENKMIGKYRSNSYITHTK